MPEEYFLNLLGSKKKWVGLNLPGECHYLQGIVRLLRQSDAQLFAGWRDHPSIYDATILRKIDSLAAKASQLLQVSFHNSILCY